MENLSTQITKLVGFCDIDFMKPDNFVKLMELPIAVETGNSFVVDTLGAEPNERFCCRITFLKLLLKKIESNDEYIKHFIEAMKRVTWS